MCILLEQMEAGTLQCAVNAGKIVVPPKSKVMVLYALLQQCHSFGWTYT